MIRLMEAFLSRSLRVFAVAMILFPTAAGGTQFVMLPSPGKTVLAWRLRFQRAVAPNGARSFALAALRLTNSADER